MDEKRQWVRFAGIVAGVALMAALLMTIAYRQQALVQNVYDPYAYGKIARGFLEHGFDRLTRRAASLYPHLLAFIYWLGGGPLAVLVLQTALHMGTCFLAFFIGARLFNARTGLLAGLACAVHPMLIRYVPVLHMETVLVFLCTLTILCAIRFHERPTVQNGVILGVVGMITTLTKGVILPYLVVFGAVELARGLRNKDARPNPIPALVAMGVSMAILLAPWTYRNYRVTHGRLVLLTPGSSDSFLRGYVFTQLPYATLQKEPYTYAENASNAWFRQIAHDAGTTWENDEVVDEGNNARVVKELIRHHPLDTVRKCVVGLFTFWYEMTNLKTSLVAGSTALAGWVLAFVGLRRAKSERNEARPAWLVLLPVVVMNVFVATLIPLGRYSAPIVPCLMVLAAFGVDTLLDRRTAPSAVAETARS